MATKKKADSDYDSFWSFINGEDDIGKREKDDTEEKQKETKIEEQKSQETNKPTIPEELEDNTPKELDQTNNNGNEQKLVNIFNDFNLFDTDDDSDGGLDFDSTFEDEEDDIEKESDDWIPKPAADKIKPESNKGQEVKQTEQSRLKEDAVDEENKSQSSLFMTVIEGLAQMTKYIMGSKLALGTYGLAIIAAVLALRINPTPV